MPISFDARNHRWRYFFDRKVGAERKRTSRLLPKGWDRYKAQEFDRIETARLYALATGVTKPEHLIDAAVLLYLTPTSAHAAGYRQDMKHYANNNTPPGADYFEQLFRLHIFVD
jgi:hypothetical protein